MYSFVADSLLRRRVSVQPDSHGDGLTMSCPPALTEPPHRPTGVTVREWRNLVSGLDNLDLSQSVITIIKH